MTTTTDRITKDIERNRLAYEALCVIRTLLRCEMDAGHQPAVSWNAYKAAEKTVGQTLSAALRSICEEFDAGRGEQYVTSCELFDADGPLRIGSHHWVPDGLASFRVVILTEDGLDALLDDWYQGREDEQVRYEKWKCPKGGNPSRWTHGFVSKFSRKLTQSG